MRVILSAAATKDGYLDDTSAERLVISSAEDWREVHELRAAADAILVGAETIRRDNPSLVIRDEKVRAARAQCGMSPDIVKVAVSGSGRLDTSFRFFTEGPQARKIIFVRTDADTDAADQLRTVAEVIPLPEITAKAIVGELSARGINTLMVEGGGAILKMFIDEDAADELRLAVGTQEIGGKGAARMPYFGAMPFEGHAEKTVREVGGMTVSHYAIHGRHTAGVSSACPTSEQDHLYLQEAIDLSRNCVPSRTAYCVGCVIITADGRRFTGYTHETAPRDHAEEEAINKALGAGASLRGATAYTSMEPCSTRSSKPMSCSELILLHGIARVVYAYAEPACFVNCEGTAILRANGVEVCVMEDLAGQVAEINRHIIGDK